jgi:hypothetical protein
LGDDLRCDLGVGTGGQALVAWREDLGVGDIQPLGGDDQRDLQGGQDSQLRGDAEVVGRRGVK